jgi:hypothetical protein
MNKFSRQTGILGLLAALFLAPGLAAFIFFKHPQWLGGSGTNRGAFVEPVVEITSLTETQGDKRSGTWHMVIWRPNTCDANCLRVLEKVARIRIALGRHYYEIKQEMLFSSSVEAIQADVRDSIAKRDTAIHQVTPKEAAYFSDHRFEGNIFIANPQGFLVLSYDEQVAPDDIYHDMKRLLGKNG